MIVSLIATNCYYLLLFTTSALFVTFTSLNWPFANQVFHTTIDYAISRQPAKFFLWCICMVVNQNYPVIWRQTRKSKEQQTWRPSKIRRRRQMWLHNVIGMNHIIHTNTLKYSCRFQKEGGEGAVQQKLEGCSRVRWVETSLQTWELLVAVDRAVWKCFVAAQ